jgi:hypothetical protein
MTQEPKLLKRRDKSKENKITPDSEKKEDKCTVKLVTFNFFPYLKTTTPVIPYIYEHPSQSTVPIIPTTNLEELSNKIRYNLNS